jgi:hypothetical protein
MRALLLALLLGASVALASEYVDTLSVLAAGGGGGSDSITFDVKSQATAAAPSTSPITVAHAGGTPEGVVVFCYANDTSADVVTGATYDGVAMTQIANENDTGAEIMFAEAYFLASPSAGTVNAACAFTGTQEMVIQVISVDASGTPAVAGFCTLGENATNPSCNVTPIAAESYGVGGLASGQAATSSVSAISGYTIGDQTNIGGTGQSFHTTRQTSMQASGDNTIGFTAAVDDAALVGVALEVP